MDGVIVESEIEVSKRESSKSRRSTRRTIDGDLLVQPSSRISQRMKAIRDEGLAVRKGESRRMVFGAAKKTAEFLDCMRAHYRETKRRDVDIEADIKLFLADGTVFDTGTARVRNVSPSGALLADIELTKDCFPNRPFRVGLLMKSGEFEGIGFEATPVRFVPEQRGIGVKFDEVFVSCD